jgi:CHAT domain-containing protein
MLSRKYLTWLWPYFCICLTVLVLVVSQSQLWAQPNLFMAELGKPTALELLEQGETFYQAGQYQFAAGQFRQAVQTAAQQDDRLTQATAWSNLALSQFQLGQSPAAEQALQNSLQLLSSQSLSSQALQPRQQQVLAATLNIQGQFQLARGQTETALQTWQRATQIYQSLGDHSGQVASLINQAQAEQSLGFYRRSLTTLALVQTQLLRQPDSLTKVTALRSLGNAYRLSGDFERSESILQQSWQLGQRLQNPDAMSAVALSLGNSYRNIAHILQDRQVPMADMAATPWQCPVHRPRNQALERYQQALQAYQQASAIATTPTLKLLAELNRFDILTLLQQWPAAESLWQSQQGLLQDLPPSRPAFFAQIHVAVDLTCAKQAGAFTTVTWTEIARRLAQTAQQAKTVGDQRAESFSLGYLGGLYLLTGQIAMAQELTETALGLAQAVQANDLLYRWQWQLGQLYRTQHQTSAAIKAYGETMKYLRRLRYDLATINPEAQFSFRDQVEPVYRQFVALLLQPEGSGQTVSQDRLVQARQMIESLQVAELENFFRAACLDARPVALEQIDTQAAVVYPIVLGNQLKIILSLPRQPLQLFSSSLPANWFTLLERFQQALGQRNNPDAILLSQRIYRWLIAPIAATLQANGLNISGLNASGANSSGVNTLVFVPDSPLRNIPMAALHDGKQYLLENYNLGLTPGLQLLQSQPQKPARQRRVLLGGLSVARQGFPALTFVEQEMTQIKTAIQGQILINQAFTDINLRQALQHQRFPIVHLATHGQFSSQLDQTFILTWNLPLDIEQLNGLLQPLGERATPVDLLVLSACETAAGDRRSGLGLAGIAVRSGASSTLASLWVVNDEAAASLIQEFYQALSQPQKQPQSQTQVTKAQALRRAQLKLLHNSRYRHPYYWAPFVLVGNWL